MVGIKEKLNGAIKLKRWQLYTSIILAVMVILAQAFVLASDRWGVIKDLEFLSTEVHNNSKAIELNTATIKEHTKIIGHNVMFEKVDGIETRLKQVEEAIIEGRQDYKEILKRLSR